MNELPQPPPAPELPAPPAQPQSSGPSEYRAHLRPGVFTLGALIALTGLALVGIAVTREAGWDGVAPQLALHAFGWGGLYAGVRSVVQAIQVLRHPALGGVVSHGGWLLVGGLGWIAGCALMALGFRQGELPRAAPSEAVGAPLYPPLARYRDFTWSTLFAYGGGILLSELVLIGLQTLLAGGGSRGEKAALPALAAFAISALVAVGVAFGAGFWGASRSRRLAGPEATLGFIYFGLPVPLFLSLIPYSPWLALNVGFRLREVLYLAGLIGRPEISFWLAFCVLVLVMVLGITSGFVATGSGRVDLRAGYELFVARRHVAVFRPRLLLGVLAVLLFGIIPPLLVLAMLRAAEAAVERTRIRKLGERDPLRATEALNAWKAREQTPTAMMTALSVGGVGVGVMALIIVLSVMSGFEVDLQKKILGTNADAVVLKYGEPMDEYRDVMGKIRAVPGVVGETPFIMNQVMLASDQNIDGVIIKGIDPKTVGQVIELPKNVLPGGSIDNLIHPERIEGQGGDVFAPDGALDDGPPAEATGKRGKKSGALEQDPFINAPATRAPQAQVLPGILIGRELAGTLKLRVGDRVNVVSPLGGELGPQGPTPKSRPFRVAGIFYTGMYEYDSKFAYIDLGQAESFFGQKGVTGIELKVTDVNDARRISNEVLEKLDGYPYQAKDWGEMNHNLFSALRLEKLVMGIILSLIVVVAAGLIIATVIMLVLEKRKEISVLKALGVSDGGIVKIFLAEGLQIGIAGGLLGLVSGLGWCFFIEKFGLKLDPQVYYIPNLPVKIEPLQTALSVVIAVLVTYLASVYPALKASRVEPVEGLKAE